ncbi:PLP-dependent aminotransferase family protein [Shewanella litorisediminis]|uniref:PLP-dependent aminotransferase family protein n=1 Tax=Shewanella litorisediminis TaxID=1173586 RepID=A0ABX7FZ37_9GAMM|nr:PLP-dependent aminotransferase family protein [Shewanella litorisediminis]MCL2918726.1 PLP-dependent aminotransferase family protein [Shewanella litorisediminis]QRH00301.1 PLP-dependent aminotransferase family protein [Shewanella litorisediminis]
MSTIWTPRLEDFSGSKYEQLANAIGDAITRGELTPGTKLPPQRRLADALGVTLGTITRAYTKAIYRGWVEARVGDGTYVRMLERKDTGPLDLATCQQAVTDQATILGDVMTRMGRDPVRLAGLLDYHATHSEVQQETVLKFLAKSGVNDFGGKLVFTQGAQQGLYAALAAVCAPGDWVLHEAWCYPGLNRAAEALDLNLCGIPLVNDGLDLDELAACIERHKPKAIYLTPNSQNPACIGYSESQRQRILALARANDIIIIEDDVNYCTSTEWSQPIWQLAADAQSVVYLSSISKRFAGGIRFGFMLLPARLLPRVNRIIHAQCWMVSPLLIEIGCELIRSGGIHQHRDAWITSLQQRFLAMAASLDLEAKSRGLNGRLTLPEGFRANNVIAALASKGILARSLADFGGPANGIRFSLGRIPRGEEDEVFSRIHTTLADVLNQGIAVV